MRKRDILNKIVLLILITTGFLLTSCNSSSEKSVNADDNKQSDTIPGIMDIDIKNPETAGFRYTDWDGVLDERGFDPLNFMYPTGSVKETKVWATGIAKGTEKEHILTKVYDDHRRLVQKKTYYHSDESGWNYIYDDYGRLIIVEETFNGEIVPERQLTYKYLPFDPDKNKVVREVFKQNILIRVETEQIVDNKISLEFDYTDKKTTVTNSLYFENGNIIKHVDVENFKYETNFEYDEHGILIKTIELTSKGKERFIYDFKYNENDNIVEGITNDYRHDPPTIMRTQKAMNHDQHGNWLRKELYEDDILVGLIEREISYY